MLIDELNDILMIDDDDTKMIPASPMSVSLMENTCKSDTEIILSIILFSYSIFCSVTNVTR